MSTTIASPPSEVAAFTSDARNEGPWHTDVLEVSHISGDDGVKTGTTYHVRTTPAMGGVAEGTETVLEHLQDRTVFEWRLGKLTSVITHSVRPMAAASRVHQNRRPAEAGISGDPSDGRKANTQFIANLKHMLERLGTAR